MRLESPSVLELELQSKPASDGELPISVKGEKFRMPKMYPKQGTSVSWTFELDHMQRNEDILFLHYIKFFTLMLGSPFSLPPKADNEKREFSQLQGWMTQGLFGARGIKSGPNAAC